ALLLADALGEPFFYKPWKPVLLDHANPVKIKVAAVLLRRFRVENVSALQSKLALDQCLNFGSGQSAVNAAKIFIELFEDLRFRQVIEWQEIVEQANGIADT